MSRARPYHYVRFNWFKKVDLKKAERVLSVNFEVKMVRIPWNDMEISIGDDMSEELRVEADTLAAFLSTLKVVLFQRKPAPFTTRDMELRKIMMELYPRERPTPFPFMFGREPSFEVVEQ
jgi:hypothetical protein